MGALALSGKKQKADGRRSPSLAKQQHPKSLGLRQHCSWDRSQRFSLGLRHCTQLPG